MMPQQFLTEPAPISASPAPGVSDYLPGAELGAMTDPPSIAEATSTLITNMTNGDFSGLTDYATTHLAPAMLSAGIGLFVIFLGYLIAKYLMRVISTPVCRRVDETLGKFVGKMVFYVIMAGVVGAVLSKLGAPLGGLAAMLAAAGFAVGLAFQGTLSNFASGVLMLVFRPFKVGDVVTAASVTGKVNEIDLFTTTLDTPDNRRIIVPNSSISGGTIENMTHHAHRRVEVCVGVDYTADLQTTREALTLAVENLNEHIIPGEGRGSAVVLAGLGASSVDWKVRVWVAASNFWPVNEMLLAEVKTQLDEVNIGIPYPQMDIHVKNEDNSVGIGGPAKVRPSRRASERLAG